MTCANGSSPGLPTLCQRSLLRQSGSSPWLGRSAAQLAGTYAQAGFAVAIDDVIDPDNAATLFEQALAPLPIYKVLLRPDLQKALERNAERTHKAFDTSVLIGVIERIYSEQSSEAYQAANWLVVDSSRLTVEETVDTILSHFKPTPALE